VKADPPGPGAEPVAPGPAPIAGATEIRFAPFERLDIGTLYALMRLRVDVFVVEQTCPYPELDGRDTEPGTRHVWHSVDGRPVGYLRIMDEPDGGARIGRVCVDRSQRGTGLARRLMTAALDRIGERTCVLDAQSHLAGFYAGLGFQPDGPEFVEDGIPHVPMCRPGSRSASRDGTRPAGDREARGDRGAGGSGGNGGSSAEAVAINR
jgi:ElaA protein